MLWHASELASTTEVLAWVRIVHYPAESPERKQGAMQGLIPLILPKARSAAARLPEYLRYEAVAAAPSWIWAKIGSFDSTRGSFAG